MAKRGRGRPKTAVPPSPPNLASLVSIPVNTTQKDESKKTELVKTPTVVKKDSVDVSTDSRNLWVDVLNENRNPNKGLAMAYVAPARVEGDYDIEIEEEDVTTELRLWENTLVLYGLGEDLSMNMVKNFMTKTWNFVTLPDMYYHEEGYFLLRFKTHDDMENILMKGPYTLQNIPIVVKEWRPDYNVKEDLLRTLPIWVKLPKLPLHLWGARSLNNIGSAIGVPLVTDKCTAHKLRVSYARILVEVDITRQLLDEIIIKDPEGRKLKQAIEYEWHPKFCEKCQKVGHQCGVEPKRRVWKPKPPRVEPIPDANDTPKDERIPEVEEEQNWTRVNKAIGDRGKKIITYVESSKSNDIPCVNVFEVLEVLNGQPVATETPPC
ncbi:uncharacterized protein LOC131623208 [Vicia villosa]|uniref:uncharacterized protein LOC131623208 n=1 Tax=Vicia villosa TaxID=3911 RepID=UPI00273CA323|nr:uncharacterized protein LOC131623208 [Vicia villosa]